MNTEEVMKLAAAVALSAGYEATHDALVEARNAVAELVAAAGAIKAKRGGTMALGATDARTVRLESALARFGGGK